jgi:hypothetical protein
MAQVDMLSMYDQDVLIPLVFVVKEVHDVVGVCESFFPFIIKIEVLRGTLLMISKLGLAEYCNLSQIGHGLRPHFSPCVTTDADLSWSINLGLSSSLIL